MKKYCMITLVICCLLGIMFTACRNTQDEKDLSQTSESADAAFISRPSFSFYSLEEYNKFLEEMPETEGFVTYDMLREIGDFRGFVCFSPWYMDQFDYYMYTFNEKNGGKISLYVEHRDKDTGMLEGTTIEMEQVKEEPKDLTRISQNEPAKFIYKDIEYRYVQGELISIAWTTENYGFVVLLEPEQRDNADMSEETFISALLNKDTAKAVTASISESVAK